MLMWKCVKSCEKIQTEEKHNISIIAIFKRFNIENGVKKKSSIIMAHVAHQTILSSGKRLVQGVLCIG